MSSRVKGPWWDEKRIEWYERASDHSDFQERLSALIKRFIPEDESVTELGCGLGYQGELLCRSGYRVRSYDIDSSVIKRAEERSGLGIFRVADYLEIDERRDAVLSVFFGRITEGDNLERLLSLADKHLVYIQSAHSGQSPALRRKGDNTEKTIAFLKERNIPFTHEKHTIPFPQPLKSIEEGRDFISSYYGKEKADDYLPYIKESNNREFPYSLMNNKEFIVFDIRKDKT